MGPLSGKVAVVTGAGTGIGRGIALELGRRGAHVVVHCHSSRAGAEETARQILDAGSRATVIQADLMRVEECGRLIRESVQAFGGVDILVNNAAISPEVPFLEVTHELYDRVLHTNLRGPFFCAQAAARQMIAQGRGGKIIHIGSTHGLISAPGFGPYSASKGGLHTLTRQMCLELAPYRINVNCIAPGLIEVERYFTQFPGYDRDASARLLPWGRVGLPHDIARVVAFLCSDDADFITGQVLFVDGGQTAAQKMARQDSGPAGATPGAPPGPWGTQG